MKTISCVVAAAILLAASVVSGPAEARPRGGFSFGYYGPGVSIYIGPRYYTPFGYYSPYGHYGPPPPVYRYRPPPRYGYRPAPSRCRHWSNRCARQWGYGNRNYRGCLRYHRCR